MLCCYCNDIILYIIILLFTLDASSKKKKKGPAGWVRHQVGARCKQDTKNLDYVLVCIYIVLTLSNNK